jgi:hypothetical protein
LSIILLFLHKAMSEFFTYAQLGIEHIADINGYDHILFLMALCALYSPIDWRRLLWLVTAFTVGHSLTLALSTLNVVVISPSLIEFLIPVTIFLTCVANIVAITRGSTAGQTALQQAETPSRIPQRIAYTMAAFFGLIHGLGFSNYLKSLLGRDQSIVMQLFAFNLGLEVGQLLIVSAILLLTWLMTRFAGLFHREWALVLSGAAAGVAITLMLKTFPA